MVSPTRTWAILFLSSLNSICWLLLQGIRTYDYILAMKEENQFPVDPFDDISDISSDDSSDFDSPEKPTFVSRFICRGQKTQVHITEKDNPSYILNFI